MTGSGTDIDAAPADTDVARAGRAAWAALEPLHNYMYFVPLAETMFAAAGLTNPRFAYFAARASALGEVGPLPVQASFYTFAPYAAELVFPRIWSQISAARARVVRVEAVDAALGAVLGAAAASAELHEALGLAARAAAAACEKPQGRPLFAAHAALPWPEPGPARLWHAQTLLREFRGDGHIAVLLHLGLTGLEALVLYTATEKVDADSLRVTRGWNKREWDARVATLVERRLLEPGTRWEVTPAGRALRERIEADTDALAASAYEVLGVDGCARLATLAEQLSRPVIAADVIPWLRSRGQGTRRERVRAKVRA